MRYVILSGDYNISGMYECNFISVIECRSVGFATFRNLTRHNVQVNSLVDCGTHGDETLFDRRSYTVENRNLTFLEVKERL